MDQGYNLWQQRNAAVHENSKVNTTVETIVNQQVRNLYELQHEMHPQDRQIFHLPLEELLEKTILYKKQWVEQTRITAHQCIAAHQQKMKHGQKDIRQYFQKTHAQGK